MSQLSPGTLLLAVIAIVAGAMGAYLVRENLLREKEEVAAQEPADTEYTSVPLASTDLKAGREIALGDIAVYRLTREQMEELGIAKSFMNNTQQIIGRVLKEDIDKNATFNASILYPEGTGPAIADMLEKGKRAITVPVELDSAVAGLAAPGNWVDVLFQSKPEAATRDAEDRPSVAMTLLQRVKVLAIDEQMVEGSRSVMQRSDSHMAAVTLEVDPDQATALRLVDGRGTLALSLRHPDDDFTNTSQDLITLEQLLNIPQKSKFEMEIFRGTRLSRTEFQSNGRGEQVVSRIANSGDGTAAEAQPVSTDNGVGVPETNPK